MADHFVSFGSDNTSPHGDAHVNVNDHGFNGDGHLNFQGDHGHGTVGGTVGGDGHGHNSYGVDGGFTWDNGMHVGAGVSVNPGGQPSFGVGGGFTW